LYSGYNRDDPESFIQPFADVCNSIIPRWQSQIQVFELFNEPNDWVGGDSAQLPPHYFAELLQSVYELKFNFGWSATLVSGPLFSHDFDDGSSYLYSTYVEGMETLAWDWFHENTGQYPLDGIGYHIYTTQGSSSSQEVQAGMKKNLDAIWNNGVLAGERYRFPGQQVNKQLWISEWGYGSGKPSPVMCTS
jgi:hypothetical protein